MESSFASSSFYDSLLESLYDEKAASSSSIVYFWFARCILTLLPARFHKLLGLVYGTSTLIDGGGVKSMIELLFTMRFVWSRIVVASVALPSSIPLGAPFPFYFVPVEIFLLGYFLDFWSFFFFSPSEELLSTPLKSRLNPPWMRSWFFLIESLMIYFFSLRRSSYRLIDSFRSDWYISGNSYLILSISAMESVSRWHSSSETAWNVRFII